ncbi:ATP-grasp domain-containing protein [Paenibacillus sp. 19GGS1-52]|uniref:ATP-grasp domain-containing protein n=1 Tax=Paenibacillus sp. 19GGS1-52 TaxID=2758563 RepID=UPI001EFAD46D|nr:ATP-grasp domain-containing protein [Paenibacillus sp. 19GGS1-52]ULO05577.1 ATP-grasp domain-containing protein [Paenibacillus sp. 19GGS1-52]
MTTDHLGIPKKQNILLTGGRAPVALDLARLLHHADHQVFVAESTPYHLCRVSDAVEESFEVPSPRHHPQAYIEALEQLIISLQIDLLVPTCEEIFYIALGLERLSSRCRVLSVGLDLLHSLHHKGDFIRQAQQFGFNVPDTLLIVNSREWQRVMEDEFRAGRMVLKPAYSRFASKVIMPSELLKAKRKQRRMNQRDPWSEGSVAAPWIAQQYISGTALCTYSIVHEGTVVAHATYKSHYRTGKVGASVHFEHLKHIPIYEWVSQFVKAISFTGQIGFDFIEAEDGIVYPIECNPRATSGIHLFAQEDRLEQALLFPEILVRTGEVITPNSGRKAMLTLPMLACGFKLGWNFKDWHAWWRALREAGDVVYQQDDPHPFYEQFRIVFKACKMARQMGMSVMESLTEDIEWNGER